MSNLALVQGCFGFCLGSELVLAWCRVSSGFIYNSFPAYLRFIPQSYRMQKLMILTTPTKNLRKRSNTNTAETYGVTFKTQTRHSESKKPRNQETQKPRNPETKRRRSQETKKPRSQETQKSGNQETKRPKNQETKKPETNKPRNQETQKPRDPETKKPRN